jgi:zinc/manganese transport system substrate-binding protein
LEECRTTFWSGKLIRRLVLPLTVALIGVLLAACGSGTSSSDKTATAREGQGATSPAAGGGATTGPSKKLNVVAAENFWGSIASQLGGDRATVTAIISSPDTDPHSYEPTPADGRAIASADYVIYNGVGYDPWADQAIAANPSSSRTVLKVQDLLGLKADDNPHRWYSSDDVMKVIAQITADYKKMDPADAYYFDSQNSTLVTTGFKQYNDLVAQIKQKYAGTPIGASESIVSPLADALGLKMMTPYSFLQAISEGTDVTAQEKTTIDSQIANKQIAVYLFNTQNATPDVQRIVDAAKKQGIPIVDVTETLDPATAKFQDWQSRQLQDLATALAQATGH